MLEMKGVKKTFGDFHALSGVDLDVKPGEVFGFIGPNGAGKSTTIRVLLGLMKADAGSAEIFGQDVWRDAVEIHRRIAYVPGDVNLWPNLTGGEVIDLFGRLRGGFSKEKRDELIERFQFDPTKKCRTYSKGNRQKVALIAAFASNADLYILDEPTSGLDPLMEQTFQACVAEARAAGKSVLLSSHILSEVEKLCDRVAIIRAGEVIEQGTLSEMRHLTRTQVTVETATPLTGLAEFSGVYDLTESGAQTSFQVDTEKLSSVMAHLAEFDIMQLNSAPPALEDLFMQHYDTKEGGKTHE
ncbi:ABC-2 type transport system ATP-binding protein [Salsuginibacillus halophilus]|uniref:ABC-2 type transport system ATP-binding protein n=1 Tax=Salsuginibacillus halophilus TaxID=517424 RepID=A0A2P8HAP2_9BACI|nr:ABC-2 type transport system ATP-binding protein [Salsuginibacillus halophilus]